jgi:hypothetical protein
MTPALCGKYLQVIRVNGVPIAKVEARDLVARLLPLGTNPAVNAAIEIDNALNLNADGVDLSPEQRGALLSALGDATTPALRQLRGKLADDAAHAHGIA